MPHAVVIGVGPDGLVAANLLADGGWTAEVLEAQPESGGAVRSDRGVHSDYIRPRSGVQVHSSRSDSGRTVHGSDWAPMGA